MKINKKVLIIAIVCGLLTVLSMSHYLNSLKQTATKNGAYSEVVIAVNTIPSDVKIKSEMLTLKSLPSEAVHPEAVTSIASIVGGITNAEISKDEQVLKNRVVMENTEAGLAYRIPENMRAMTIPVTEITGVAGYINKGDNIDILVSYKDEESTSESKATVFTQLQNLKVLAVGNAAKMMKEDQALPGSLTLLVNPQQAEVLVYALNYGTMSLALRNPVDNKINSLTFYNASNFDSYRTR